MATRIGTTDAHKQIDEKTGTELEESLARGQVGVPTNQQS